MAMQESGEMYLETIYVLSRQSSSVRSVDVAEEMGYSKASVSRAVGLLKKDGLLEVDETGCLKLTEAGEEKAKHIYERHTVLSRLLMNLGVDEKTATEDACRMEHRIDHALPYYEFGYMKNQTKPNAWPTGLGFGFVWFGAANRSRTGTVSLPADFK